MRHSTVRVFTDHSTGDTVLMGEYPDRIWREVQRVPRQASIGAIVQAVQLEMNSLTPEDAWQETAQ